MSIVERAYHALLHWREVLHDMKLYRAGQRRIAPYGSRGRTHEARAGVDLPEAGHTQVARVTLVPTLRARVFHTKTGEWEDLGIIMQGDKDNG